MPEDSDQQSVVRLAAALLPAFQKYGAAVCASLLPRYQRIGSVISDKLVPIPPPACCKRLVWQGPIAILIPDT
jgi:hypothetical protein